MSPSFPPPTLLACSDTGNVTLYGHAFAAERSLGLDRTDELICRGLLQFTLLRKKPLLSYRAAHQGSVAKASVSEEGVVHPDS